NAAQMEAALLAALEKHDAESYSLLKAAQDVELAGATVDLQDLRVKEAKDGVTLAGLQKQRAQIQVGHYEELISEGTSDREIASTVLGVVGSVVSGADTGGGLFTGFGSLFGQIASQERREQEWILQRNLAQQDEVIAGQQITIAQDQVAVATQEQRI